MNATSQASCRACGRGGLESVVDFGPVPLADRLLAAHELDGPDPLFPLEAAFCPGCGLLQLTETVDPEILYRGQYPYYTSAVPSLVRHFDRSAYDLIEELKLGPGSMVVEVASNDGCMLRVFAQRGISVLGIDPAQGPAAVAERSGIPTLCEFFCAEVAARLAREGGRADLVLGNNVLNLTPDPADFAGGLCALLKDHGAAVLEVPYAVPLVRDALFDNIYHQNTGYFSLTALRSIFRPHGLFVNRVGHIPTFGGSLRVWLERREAPDGSVAAMLREEAQSGVDRPEFYRGFRENTRAKAEMLRRLVERLHGEGKRLAVYGAAGGMATTLLAYLGLDGRLVDFAVDANPHKHGLYTSGSRLLISGPGRILEEGPDYVLLLAWNYADEVLKTQEEYLRRGGRFIVPLPEPRVMGWSDGGPSVESWPEERVNRPRALRVAL